MTSDLSHDYETFKNKGNEKFKAKRYNEALRHYTDAIGCKGNEAVAYSNRAICFINLKRYHEAVSDCDKAVELDPSSTKAYYRRATAQKELFRFQNAIHDFKKVSELDPSFVLAAKEIEGIQQLILKDDRLDLPNRDKPLELRSKLPMKSFELRNQYVGTLQYREDC